MRLRFLGTNSDDGTCPTLYATDRDTYVVQGKLVADPTAISDARDLADDETLVEVPRELMRFVEEDR